jgi:hypothetical protein
MVTIMVTIMVIGVCPAGSHALLGWYGQHAAAQALGPTPNGELHLFFTPPSTPSMTRFLSEPGADELHIAVTFLKTIPKPQPVLNPALYPCSPYMPQVRVISCWALARYSYWLLAGAQEAAKAGGAAGQAGAPATANGTAQQPGAAGQIGQVIEGLCRCVLDHNRVVQASACSAVAVLAETAAHEESADVIAPYLHVSIL